MLELKSIVKNYEIEGDVYPALAGINLAFESKGMVAILGPSGCGKTTLLNIIGGLDHYTSGDVVIDGKSTKSFKESDWDAYRNEKVGFVFQNYNLIPHKNILANVAISLTLNGVSSHEIKERSLAALEAVGLKGLERKRPNQLSGGQMQRVALARAIVNNPSIILADEPTGALDSNTSIQVMDILKGISSDRLVILVTHNRELAESYADRIVEMKDGAIIKDTNAVVSNGVVVGEEKNKKTSMGLLTAIASSWSNIKTKKGRTILTAVASSFGIVGVALVMAVSNGFSGFVSRVEKSLASTAPISITKTQYSYFDNSTKINDVEYPNTDCLYPLDTSSDSYVSHTNHFTREYIKNVLEPLREDGLASNILINRNGLSFNILTEKGIHPGSGEYREINQYSTAGSYGGGISQVTSLPATIFHELYLPEAPMRESYDLIYGKYPQNPDEIVLITDSYNQIELKVLNRLGFYSSTDDTKKPIDFADIVTDEKHEGKTYKAYPNSTIYKDLGSEQPVTMYEISPELDGDVIKFVGTKKTKNQKIFNREWITNDGLKNIYENDEQYDEIKLKIVGVLRPAKNSYLSLMPGSIGYLSSLKDIFVNDSETNCEELHKAATSSFYVPETTYDGVDGLQAANDVFKDVFNSFNATDPDDYAELLSGSIISKIASCFAFRYFFLYGDGNPLVDIDDNTGLLYYSGLFNNAKLIGADFHEDQVAEMVEDILYGKNKEQEKAKEALINKLLSPEFYKPGWENDGSEYDFNVLDLIAYYESFSLIESILIFPSSLTVKSTITDRLDAYNRAQEDKTTAVYYSDFMSTITDTVGSVVGALTGVLVVFAAISLVVSCIMTAIITYVSVIERTKEIGILRACGARKRDVGRLFRSECMMVGFASGIIGIAVSYLLSMPINMIVNGIYPSYKIGAIASLNPLVAIALVVLSIGLALISGLVPAAIAAKKDPVVALRSE